MHTKITPKPDAFIVVSARGKQLSETALRRGWAGLRLHLKKNGLSDIKGFHPHALRHTFMTMLYDAGVDVKTAQVWMGHKDITTTLKYIPTYRRKEKRNQQLLLMLFSINGCKMDVVNSFSTIKAKIKTPAKANLRGFSLVHLTRFERAAFRVGVVWNGIVVVCDGGYWPIIDGFLILLLMTFDGTLLA